MFCTIGYDGKGNIKGVCACVCIYGDVDILSHPKDLVLTCSCFFFPSQGYKRKTEAAKKEYLKALAAYRASLVSKVTLMTHRPWIRLMIDWTEIPANGLGGAYLK